MEACQVINSVLAMLGALASPVVAAVGLYLGARQQKRWLRVAWFIFGGVFVIGGLVLLGLFIYLAVPIAAVIATTIAAIGIWFLALAVLVFAIVYLFRQEIRNFISQWRR